MDKIARQRGLSALLLVGAGGALLWHSHRVPEPAAELAPQPVVTRSPPEAAPPASLAKPPQGLGGQDDGQMAALVAQFNAGDYDRALRLADQQLENDSLSETYRSWVLLQLPVLLTSQGWALLRLGQCADAMALFHRALKINKLAEASKGLAVCAFKLKSFDEAEAYFEAYIPEHPLDLEMKVIFSDVLESQGRFSDALQLLESLEKEPQLPPGFGKEALEARISSMRARTRESSHQIAQSTEYFKLTYRAEDHESIVPTVSATLDSALDEFRSQWGLVLPPSPIEVILYPEQSFRDLVSYSPRWASGIYDGRIRIPVTPAFLQLKDSDTFRRILRHEMFHAVIAEQIDRRTLPPWFNEGVAQLVECVNGCRPAPFPPTRGQFLRAGEFLTRYTDLDAAKAELAYKQSLYLVRTIDYLVPDQALRTILEGLNEASPVDSDGLLKAAGITFQQLRDTAALNWQKGDPY